MRDVFRPWPGALRDSNWREDRRTSCARSINMMPTPLGGEDPRSAGGRRRRFFLAPTPGVQTSVSGRFWVPAHPPRGFLTTTSARYVAAGASATDAGALYLAGAPSTKVGDFAGSLTADSNSTFRTSNPNSRFWPPFVQMAWGGPQVGILACAANGKLAYYDERIAATDDGRAAMPGTEAAGWFNDVFGPNIDINVIGVQFFNNYFFVLDDQNNLYASPLLARNTDPDSDTGDFLPTTREADFDGAGNAGQYERYAFDLSQFAQRSLEPDPWVAMIALSDRLLLFGRETGGAWQLKADPGTGFPLQRILGDQFQVGVFGPGSVAAMGDHVYWIGRSPDGQVRAWRFGGEEGVEAISTAAVDEYLANQPGFVRDRARCTATALAGRRCFAMRIGHRTGQRQNQLGATWCYDETTNMWHERGVWLDSGPGVPAGGGWTPWEIVFAQTSAGDPWVIAEDAGPGGQTMLGFLTGAGAWKDARLTGRTPDGNAPSGSNQITPALSGLILRERITPHWGTRATLQSVLAAKLSMGSGVGRVGLAFSEDGGATFLDTVWITPNDVLDELRWFTLGAARDPVLKITMQGNSAALNDVWANVRRLLG